ncbi:MAG: MBL fold metallo-hydrolase [Chloroflexota bacterium]|nr:MAG: MBL fold metallo-hydrolase [Chloroflexota bacterium]
MLQRERVAENVYSFQSDLYAQVNAGAVVGPNWAVVIDTLALPEETLEIRQFIEQELQVPVRYVINTHFHADHTWGNYLFPNATILASNLCRELLDTRGRSSLDAAKKQTTTFRQTRIILPHLTFAEGTMSLRVGKKTLSMIFLPGHSPDNLGVVVEEDRVLFAGDVFMPIPYIVDGNADDMIFSLKQIGKMGLENVVQGHGDIVLRGEVEGSIKENLAYLSAIRRAVRKAGRRKYPWDLLEEVGVEDCGKSRVLIGGLAEDLHSRNLRALYEQLYEEPPASSEDDED